MPLLPAIGWVAEMGWGCLAHIWQGGPAGLRLGISFSCAGFILGVGVPMTGAMLWMLRHGALVRPLAVASMAGLTAGRHWPRSG